jgi:hypothetical protein
VLLEYNAMRNSGGERVEDTILPAAAWHTARMACHQTPIQLSNCSFLDFANLHKMQYLHDDDSNQTSNFQ